MRSTYKAAVALLLALSVTTSAIPARAQAVPSAVQTSSEYARALENIEAKADARRKELGIPGMALAIVKDDKIIFLKGLGYKDFENKAPVTPDTQFAIGSATKAFTALAVLMAQDEGKLSIDDSPKKYLPYFHMADPDIDRDIKIRDLMCHASGLNRTDLAMITGRLSRQELIRVAGEAKPTAKLREKFQYQNVMFAAVGEIASTVEKTPYEKLIPKRIFKPLGMKNSTMSVAEMQKA
jgi:CubicO group peptidase (beta-lactamase class C family)